MRKGWSCAVLAVMCLGVGSMHGTSLAAEPSSAETDKTSVELRWWNPTVRGSVGGDSYRSERTNEHKLDFEQDLGTDSMNAPEIRVSHGPWSIDYIRFGSDVKDYDLPAPVWHNNKKYKGDLDTDMDIDYAAVDYRHTMQQNDQAEYYWVAGARYVRVAARSTGINAYNELESDSDSASGILPAVGMGATWQSRTAAKWSGSMSVSGMPLGGHGHIWDCEASFSYKPDQNWQVSAGYRLLDMKLSRDDKTVNFQANGPFLGVSCSF